MSENLRKLKIRQNGKTSSVAVYPDIKIETISLNAGTIPLIDTSFQFFANDIRSLKNYTSSGTNPFRSNQGFVTRLQFRMYNTGFSRYPETAGAMDELTAFVSQCDIKILKNNDQIHGDNLANFIRLPQLQIGGSPIELFKDQSIHMTNGQMDFQWNPPLMIQLQSSFIVEVHFRFKPTAGTLVGKFLECRLGVLEAPQNTGSGVMTK